MGSFEGPEVGSIQNIMKGTEIYDVKLRIPFLLNKKRSSDRESLKPHLCSEPKSNERLLRKVPVILKGTFDSRNPRDTASRKDFNLRNINS